VLPSHKTKIVATIGPACADAGTLEKMIRAGMSVARLNFSHGDFAGHAAAIAQLRSAAARAGRPVAILADLPGPKMRVGELSTPEVDLRPGATFTLSARPRPGDAGGVSVSFAGLPRAVHPGAALFLNDGLIQLEVTRVSGEDVVCRVVVGGPLRARKGLNVPGADLGIAAFTERDRECLAFALAQGVDAVSQSFVSAAADVRAVRDAALALGRRPFIIAKIERAAALEVIDGILAEADGIMVARGDLGVEVPIERIAILQKHLIHKANVLGKPVITATQMLESMTTSPRPTRAEATDVANAVLDGTDAVMLSGESATGAWPVAAVEMLARIAAATEPHRSWVAVRETFRTYGQGLTLAPADLVSVAVARAFDQALPAAVFTPAVSGTTARRVARFRLPAWVVAVSPLPGTCQELLFSYGVAPVHAGTPPADWRSWAREWTAANGIAGDLAILVEGPSPENRRSNHRMEILELG
jgi:pyruvate kinase